MSAHPLVRIEDAGLGADAQVRLVLSGIPEPDDLVRAWASSGATIERAGDRLRATTTVEALARAVGRTLGPEVAASFDGVLRGAVAGWRRPAPAVGLPDGTTLACDAGPLVMGVVNVTPDSFSDGGAIYPDGHPDAAIALGRSLVDQGADLLDVGGESTRPGAEPVDAGEERDRVLPVLEGLAGAGVPLSVDTAKADVAKEALAAGATIVNDVSGGRDPDLLGAAADAGAAYVLMHTRGTPRDMQQHTDYDDVVAEVFEFLADGLQRCVDAGIAAERVLVDPGIGFAKTAEQNLRLLRDLRQLRSLGRPVLVGASRKSFIGAVTDAPDPADRLEGSLACAVLATAAGAAVVRVHDVAATVRAVRVARAIVEA